MRGERTSEDASERAHSADVIRSQLEEVDAFLFIGVHGAGSPEVFRIITSTAHGDRDTLTDCLAEVLADLRGGISRPH